MNRCKIEQNILLEDGIFLSNLEGTFSKMLKGLEINFIISD